MGWDGPILTDSGGFQVFSLRDTLLAVDDEGVTFRSVYDGSAARFTPESSRAIQANLGSDVAMCLDVCPPAGVPRAELAEAVRLTTAWATRQRDAPSARPGSSSSGSRRAPDRELRRRSIEEIVALDFDGYALGGLSVGEDRATMLETVGVGGAAASRRQARYFMGIGDPEGILEVIARGDRHVRLRPADPHRPHRLRAHVGGPAEPARTPNSPATRGRSTRAASARRARASAARTSATSSTSRSCWACGC